MKFLPLCILLAFPLFTEERCTFSHGEFSCKGTNDTNFLQEFYKNAFENDRSSTNLTINIEDSYFNVIEYFPALVPVEYKFATISLTIRNSSVEHVGRTALEELCDLENLDLSWNKLRNISFVTGLPKRVKALCLSNNNITYLDDVFNMLQGLTFLDLSHNNLRIIDFSNICWIQTLNISHNNINTLIPSLQSRLRLTKIDLSHNEITEFSEEELRTNLHYLNLSHNKLSQIEVSNDEKFFLSISSNNITKLTTANGWVVVAELDLSSTNLLLNFEKNKVIATKRLLLNNNKVPILDSKTLNIFNSYRLYWRQVKPEVDLSNSSIEDIPQHYFSFLDISLLNLSWNNIKRLRSNTFSSCNLHTLDLSSSNIQNIESGAFNRLLSSKIVLSNNKLTNVKDVFNEANMLELDLSSNLLNTVKERSFVNCYNLKVLNLSNCSISKIEKQAFFGLTGLMLIDLSYNKLHVLESDIFDNLSVRSVKLHSNSVYTVQKRAFNNMVNLIQLNLSQLGVNNLEPYAFQNLTKTEVVDLRNNDIVIIPLYLFVDMENLRTVYLSGNRISTLNPFPNRLKIHLLTLSFSGVFRPYDTLNLHLKYLYLKNSRIDRLKRDSFAGLYNLVELHFDNTYVDFIEPGALNNLFNLQSLDSQNLFIYAKTIRQNTFRDLRSLVFLNLSRLSLEDVETESFVGLNKLQTLLLSSNSLTHLVGNTFFGLVSLETLDLSRNNINACDGKAFVGLENLENLYLQFNNLLTIESEVLFGGLGKLLELHIEGNNISSLGIESFSELKSLRKLYLQNNSMDDIPVGVFQFLPTLILLNLSNNKIQMLKTGALSNLQSLEILDLSENRLVNLEYVDIFFSLKQLKIIWLDGNHLKQFDFRRFLINLRKIIYIGISNNKWKCDTLSHIIESLNNRNVNYRPQNPIYDNDNIDGVGCVDICKLVYCSYENVEQPLHYY